MLPESDEIAESMEEVRGGALAVSARCAAELEAIVGRVLVGVLVGGPPEGFEFRAGSDTLREAPLVSKIGWLYLLPLELLSSMIATRLDSPEM